VAGTTASLAICAAVVLAAPAWRDPLGLGRRLGWLPWALWGWCLLSTALSPVPRSGRVALLLLPAFLLLPAIVAGCLEKEADRVRATRALALVTALVSTWALGDWLALGSPRPAMPLGHHNLLAAWLVTLLPLSLVPAREAGRWRWLGWMAFGLALAALLATRSLAGLAALTAQAAIFAWTRQPRLDRPSRRSVLAAGIVVAIGLGLVSVLAGERLRAIASGADPSLRARATYWRAGLAGIAARPFAGWGPGSAGWTISAFLAPVPGVNPPGEVVGELHDLPLSLAYELGVPGLSLALSLVSLFFAARLRDLSRAGSGVGAAAPRRAGLLGLLGAGVASLGGASIAVTGLPIAAAVAAGFALGGGDRGEPERSRFDRPLALAFVLVASVLLLPILTAQLCYDGARHAEAAGDRAGASRALARAVALDGEFPLYRWRLALAEGSSSHDRAAGGARRAARDGRGIAVLWESAGILGLEAGSPWAPEALARAEALAPMSALAPFHLALAERDSGAAATSSARSILGEPRLAWACAWRTQPHGLESALGEVVRWPGVDAGWKERLVAEARQDQRVVRAQGDALGWKEDAEGILALTVDGSESTSMSLLVFHRRPWPLRWPLVPLCFPGDLPSLPSAWELATTSPSALQAGRAPIRSVRGQMLLTH
jgi:O-antigen ligase